MWWNNQYAKNYMKCTRKYFYIVFTYDCISYISFLLVIDLKWEIGSADTILFTPRVKDLL